MDAQISAPRPDGTYPLRRDGATGAWSPRPRRLVIAIDPAAVVNRRRTAEADRHLSIRPAPDTMSRISVLLPATQGVAVWATLTKIADQARNDADPRSRGQVMVDTLVERITGQTRADAVPITVNVVISDQALLAGGHEPAWLQGHGPIPADTIDPQAMTATPQALRHPHHGSLVGMESVARDLPVALARFIDLRDQTCRTPYCDAPDPTPTTTPTTTPPADPPPPPTAKASANTATTPNKPPAGKPAPSTAPPGQPHTVETTLPTGHTTTNPPHHAAPLPATLQPVSRAEIAGSPRSSSPPSSSVEREPIAE